ncbi:MAG: hypothetical protein LUG57_00300 [Oscillospiraceae bacterium]|nr:hypothetical protein [Oscillospiraceae bacterium]
MQDMEIPIYIDGQREGTVSISHEGSVTVLDAALRDVGRVVRLRLFGDGEGYLGVPEPKEGRLRLTKRVPPWSCAGSRPSPNTLPRAEHSPGRSQRQSQSRNQSRDQTRSQNRRRSPPPATFYGRAGSPIISDLDGIAQQGYENEGRCVILLINYHGPGGER